MDRLNLLAGFALIEAAVFFLGAWSGGHLLPKRETHSVVLTLTGLLALSATILGVVAVIVLTMGLVGQMTVGHGAVPTEKLVESLVGR